MLSKRTPYSAVFEKDTYLLHLAKASMRVHTLSIANYTSRSGYRVIAVNARKGRAVPASTRACRRRPGLDPSIAQRTILLHAICCTVHSQASGVAGRSGCVGGCASVLPGVSRAHSLDSHHADALAVSRDRHIPVILLGDRFAVQRPRYLDRQISLQDRADRRDRLSPIRGLVADRERRDLRSD